MFRRQMFAVLKKRIQGPRLYMQVLAGPRQTGKTTLITQITEDLKQPSHYATADEPAIKGNYWIEQVWEAGRALCKENGKFRKSLLVLDEIQKIPGWSETVKRLWDADTRSKLPLQVVLLGSAPLLLQTGLSESLAGRFEVLPVPHWGYREMQEAFGFTLEQYIYYGGYPGSAPLIDDYARWRSYILQSLVETTVSRDILLMKRIDKPVLLRRLFELGCRYSGQILSYNKMLGQLQDAGNTTTLAHYLELLQGAGLMQGLAKYASQKIRRRKSSPKFQVHNNALISAQVSADITEAQSNPELWGRLVESSIGVHLINGSQSQDIEIGYWNSGNHEVDFVLSRGKEITAIEVKSTMRKGTLPGIKQFSKEFNISRAILVGADGIPLEHFLSEDPAVWL